MNPGNQALLTVAALGAKGMINAAPCVILAQLTNDDLAGFREVLAEAATMACKTIAAIDNHLRSQELQRAENAERGDWP